MKSFRLILITSLALLAAGCASTAQLAERNKERCAARGYAPGSDDFSNCVTQLETERSARMEASRREMMERPSTPYIPAGSNH